MGSALVRADRLSRSFGTRVAVSGLSLTLHAGEIVALLGPNGAGKTTTLRMLAGLLAPSAGTVTIGGAPMTPHDSDRLRAQIGLLTEAPGLWDRLSVRLNLSTYARLYGLAAPEMAVDRVMETVAIGDRAGDLTGSLSKGLRQRVAIARALIHEPPILLLDEPTSGLDPAAARQVRDLIASLRRQGRALLVSTHNLAEAEELADRIAVLNTTLLALETPAALSAERHHVRVEIDLLDEARDWRDRLTLHAGETAAAAGSTLQLTLADRARIADVVAALAGAGARVVRVTPRQRSLEEVYLALVGDSAEAAS